MQKGNLFVLRLWCIDTFLLSSIQNTLGCYELAAMMRESSSVNSNMHATHWRNNYLNDYINGAVINMLLYIKRGATFFQTPTTNTLFTAPRASNGCLF